jgi:hypothetical protein
MYFIIIVELGEKQAKCVKFGFNGAKSGIIQFYMCLLKITHKSYFYMKGEFNRDHNNFAQPYKAIRYA